MNDNIRTYDDNGQIFGAFFVEGVENRFDGVIYEWNFMDGIPTVTVYVEGEEFNF